MTSNLGQRINRHWQLVVLASGQLPPSTSVVVREEKLTQLAWLGWPLATLPFAFLCTTPGAPALACLGGADHGSPDDAGDAENGARDAEHQHGRARGAD